MAAFIEDDMNNPHIGILVFMASIPNFDDPSVIPNFFCKFKKIHPTSLLVRDVHLAKLRFTLVHVCLHHFASVSRREKSPKSRFSSTVSGNLHLECFTVTSLESARLGAGLCLAPVSRRKLKHRLAPP